MTCSEIQDLLALLLSGEMEARDAEAVESHLAACASCRAARDRMARGERALRGHFADLRGGEVSRRAAGRLRPAGRGFRASRFLPPLGLAAAAAGVLLTIGIHQGLGTRGQGPGVRDPGSGIRDPGVRETGRVLTLPAGTVTLLDGAVARLEGERVMLESGEIFVDLAGPHRVVVETPAGRAIPRGTRFWVSLKQGLKQREEGAMGRKRAKTWGVAVTVLAGMVELANPFGSITAGPGERIAAEEGAAPRKQVEDLALRFARYYEPVKTGAGKPKIPAYPLPLDPGQIANWKEVSHALGIPEHDPSILANGFAVIPGAGNEDIVAPYKDVQMRGIPVFVTADTLLHLYHVQFGDTLKGIEEREFYRDICQVSESVLASLEKAPLPADTPAFQEARKKALTYFAIGLSVLKPGFPLPKGVPAKDVSVVLEKIAKHEGFWPAPESAHLEWPLFRYTEDFSQYVPRGHYTRSKLLKAYFVAMMWYGRMSFILKGGRPYGPNDEPFLVSEEEAEAQTLASAMITKAIGEAKLPDGRSAQEAWERIYAVTSFYVGLADDLGLPEYKAGLEEVCGSALDLATLAEPGKIDQYRLALARFAPPAIYSGTGWQGTSDPSAGPEKLLQALDKTTGYRFMGQRFVPDSHMMGKLVFPTVGPPTRVGMFTCVAGNSPIRGFPRGLDVMALLGSDRARQLLRELGDDAYEAGPKALSYDQALASLAAEYAGLSDADWNRNLYWSWLHALKPLLAEYGEGYPTFMTTEAYRTKSLNTALASWAQLRHDTILYAKQSYTIGRQSGSMRQPKPVEGYVEPLPEFYARLLTLVRMTNRGLSEMKVLDAASSGRLSAFEKLLERLLAIVEKELADAELTADDYAFIREFGERVAGVVVAGGDGQAMKTTLIADVHTDQNTEHCLEVGTGYVDLGLFVYRQPDGRLVAGAGPVLSFYEFKQPIKDRLTDEKWRALLKGEAAPAQPVWTDTYRVRGTVYRCQAIDD